MMQTQTQTKELYEMKPKRRGAPELIMRCKSSPDYN
jgi:hypothetical protein